MPGGLNLRLSRRRLLKLTNGACLLLAGGALGRLIYIFEYQPARYIYRGHNDTYDEIEALAWSPNSQRVASGAENLQVWDALSGAHVQTFPARGGIQAVAWSPDGKYLASGNGIGTATVWEAATRKKLLTYQGHIHYKLPPDMAGARAALVHPLSARLATAGVRDLAWSPDGTRLLSSGPEDTAQVWEALTGRTLLTLGSRAAFVGNAIWSPYGRLIAAITEQGVHLWDATTGMQLSGTPEYSPPSDVILFSLAWSPNGRYLASASEQYQFSELASASEQYNDSDQVVRVWEAATGRDVLIYRGHTDSVRRAVWSPDSKYLASAGFDMTVRVWAATTGQTKYIYRGHESFWQQFFTAQAPQAPTQPSQITQAHPGAPAGSQRASHAPPGHLAAPTKHPGAGPVTRWAVYCFWRLRWRHRHHRPGLAARLTNKLSLDIHPLRQPAASRHASCIPS